MQYIEYARQQKAHRKLSDIFTNALRIHPTSVDLWMYATRHAMDDHADMMHARSYMQRGLRFCRSSRKLWIHYARLELVYIAKLVARQRILGLDKAIEPAKPDTGGSFEDPNADVIKLPKLTEEDISPEDDEDVDDNVAALQQNLQSSSALSGAIPIAIFDSAMKNFNNDDRFGHEFYNMVLEFESIPCLREILGRVVEVMMTATPASSRALICYIRYPTVGLRVNSPEFPRALGASLGRLKEHRNDRGVAREVVNWLQPLARTEDLDPALQKVMAATILSAERTLAQE